MKFISTGKLAVLAFLVSGASILGAPLPVTLTYEHHTIYVSRGIFEPGGLNLESRTTDASVPISDSLISGATWVNARAESSVLRIAAFAAADFPNHDTSSASARTEFNFIPDATAVAPIAIDFTGGDHWYFSSGSVSLFDVTSSSSLWSYDWSGFSGTVPWVYSSVSSATALLTLPTNLLDTHEYRFTLFTQVDSQEPSLPEIVIELSGLQVPEPTAFALTALAGVGLLASRSHRLRRA